MFTGFRPAVLHQPSQGTVCIKEAAESLIYVYSCLRSLRSWYVLVPVLHRIDQEWSIFVDQKQPVFRSSSCTAPTNGPGPGMTANCNNRLPPPHHPLLIHYSMVNFWKEHEYFWIILNICENDDLLARFDEFHEVMTRWKVRQNAARACESPAWVPGLAIQAESAPRLACHVLPHWVQTQKNKPFLDATCVLRNGGKTRPADNKADTHSECLRSQCFCTKQEISKSFKPGLPRPSKIERPYPWSVVRGMLVSQKVKDATGNTQRPGKCEACSGCQNLCWHNVDIMLT